MLQKMGKVDDTKDEAFQRYVANFNAQHVSCAPYLVYHLQSCRLVSCCIFKEKMARLYVCCTSMSAKHCVHLCVDVNLAPHDGLGLSSILALCTMHALGSHAPVACCGVQLNMLLYFTCFLGSHKATHFQCRNHAID